MSWYCDVALQGQQSIILVTGSHLIWNGVVVPCPPGNPNLLYVRMHPNGSKFAGVGHTDDLCWEYNGTVWTSHGPAFGPQSVIYDRGGILRIKSGPPASGFRHVDSSNRIWTCDETRGDLVREIWDFSDHGDLCIGQGGDALGVGDDPVIAIYQGKRKLLQTGTCRFINSYRQGNSVAYACWRLDTNESLTRFLTISDIIASPDIGLPPPPGSGPPSGTILAPLSRKVPDQKLGKQPEFADLKGILAQTRETENPLYQVVAQIIDRLTQFQKITTGRIEQVNDKTEGGNQDFANKSATYHTKNDETSSLPNSVQLLPGTNIVFDDSILNRRVINATGSSVDDHYDCPLSDGNTIEADLIYANGECIIVQVPI